MAAKRHKTVLFLCSGNYYRSRFAEIVFNHLAMQSGLRWKAESRALRLNPANVGPISVHATKGLSHLGLEVREPVRFPIRVAERDLASADRIIAVKEDEHRAMIQKWFPTWLDRVEFWHVHDLDCAEPEEALAKLHAEVSTLHDQLLNSEAVSQQERYE